MNCFINIVYSIHSLHNVCADLLELEEEGEETCFILRMVSFRPCFWRRCTVVVRLWEALLWRSVSALYRLRMEEVICRSTPLEILRARRQILDQQTIGWTIRFRDRGYPSCQRCPPVPEKWKITFLCNHNML